MFPAVVLAASLSILQGMSQPPTDRTERIHKDSKGVMPFSMDSTQHVFRKTDSGGVQAVTTRKPDPDQEALVRAHLRKITAQLQARDFSGPAHLHGAAMPGLRQMRESKTDQLEVTYADTTDGGQITYVAHTPALVDAVHRWFDAQVSDHGADARMAR